MIRSDPKGNAQRYLDEHFEHWPSCNKYERVDPLSGKHMLDFVTSLYEQMPSKGKESKIGPTMQKKLIDMFEGDNCLSAKLKALADPQDNTNTNINIILFLITF